MGRHPGALTGRAPTLTQIIQEEHNREARQEEKMFCHHCDDSLAGHRYVLRDDHPYCIKCYENVFANNCDECGKIIGIDSKDLSYKEKHWHEACFLCNKCRTSLVDKQFGSKADRIYCGPCYDAQFATRCDGCGDVFKAGMKKMEYKTRQWHEKCFICCTCKNPIGTKSFILLFRTAAVEAGVKRSPVVAKARFVQAVPAALIGGARHGDVVAGQPLQPAAGPRQPRWRL